MADSSDSEPEFEEVEPVVLPGAHSSAAVEAEDSDDEPVIEYLTDDEVTLVDEEEDPPVIEDLDTEFAAVPRELADLSIFEAKEALEKAMFTARETKSRGNDAFRSGALENALAWYAEARRDLEAYAGLAARLGDYDRRMTPATTKQASATDELRDLRVDLLMNGVLCKLRQRKFGQVLDDCGAALGLDGTCVKAMYRRGLALEGLGRHDDVSKGVEPRTAIY